MSNTNFASRGDLEVLYENIEFDPAFIKSHIQAIIGCDNAVSDKGLEPTAKEATDSELLPSTSSQEYETHSMSDRELEPTAKEATDSELLPSTSSQEYETHSKDIENKKYSTYVDALKDLSDLMKEDTFVHKICEMFAYTGFDPKNVVKVFEAVNDPDKAKTLVKIIILTLKKGSRVAMKLKPFKSYFEDHVGLRKIKANHLLLTFPVQTCIVAEQVYKPQFILSDDENKLPKCIFVNAFMQVIHQERTDFEQIYRLFIYYQHKVSKLFNKNFASLSSEAQRAQLEKYALLSLHNDSIIDKSGRIKYSKKFFGDDGSKSDLMAKILQNLGDAEGIFTQYDGLKSKE